MADATDGQKQAGGGADFNKSLNVFRETVLRPDVGMAFAIVAVLTVLILPMPTWLLDAALALSISAAVLILMVVLFIEKPTDLTSFPTILLITTMLRLSLNLASTRLILSFGHEGTAAAGQVIQAFGGFIMGGNFVIGVIVFAILVLVNFMVITKGSGRIAEVSARFTLDAMPGKQMAIDADLSSGLIDEATARARRQELEDENQFFGSMDGAAKFVRGDAVAGLIITFINVIGGIIIGVGQKELSFSEAASSYTQLTVGDGLVSQIPALVISVASGLLVTKGSTRGSTDKALVEQLGSYPHALGMTAFLMAVMALLPGLPMIPFFALALAAGAGAFLIHRKQEPTRAKAERMGALPPGTGGPPPLPGAPAEPGVPGAPAAPPAEEPIATALHLDLLRLELGYGLLPLVNAPEGQRLTDQVKALRRQLAQEMGFIMPSVRIQDNLQLEPNLYIVRVKEIEAGRGDLRPHQLLVMDPRGAPIQIPGEHTIEPTFQLPAMWIDQSMREEALFRGYTVVEPSTVITTHITEMIKDHMPELLSYAETQKLIDEVPVEHAKLVEDLIPSQVSVAMIQRVLQALLAERISIRDLPLVLEAISEGVSMTRNVTLVAEHVRARLARQISEANVDEEGVISLITLSPEWEQAFAESIVGQGEDRQLSMAPSRLQEFINTVRQTFERMASMGQFPALLTSPGVRPFVRSIIERFRPTTVVLSQNEIYPKAKIRTLGQI